MSIDRARWLKLEPYLDEALEMSTEQRELWLARLRAQSPDVAGDLTLLLSGEPLASREGFLEWWIATALGSRLRH
jgi:hypothetical protein